MSETLSVSQCSIERDLSALQKFGVLVREGKDNDGLWIISLGANICRQSNLIDYKNNEISGWTARAGWIGGTLKEISKSPYCGTS